MAVHTQSLLLASVGMYEIVISFPIAFFFYRVVFGVKYFQTLQVRVPPHATQAPCWVYCGWFAVFRIAHCVLTSPPWDA